MADTKARTDGVGIVESKDIRERAIALAIEACRLEGNDPDKMAYIENRELPGINKVWVRYYQPAKNFLLFSEAIKTLETKIV